MTMFTRRELLMSGGAAGLSLAIALDARAAIAFPEKNISFIIPYGPGGGFDTFARAISPVMERYLPNPVNIIPMNVPTGGGGKALIDMQRTRPDGYTIGVFPIPGALILQEQQNARRFNLYDFSWLGSIGPGDTYAIGVRNDSPIRTVADMQELSKTREVSFTCTGPDGTSYMATVIACHLLGINSKYIVGYGGSNDYIVAVIRGDGDAAIAANSSLRRFQGEGGIRIIATFERESTLPGVPDAPALGQPELAQITIERMVGGPPGLPTDIRALLTNALDQAVRDPEVVAWAESVGVPWAPNPPGQADRIFREQAAFFDKWKTVLTET
jgi:tripartite-type tricarboxylate transporter receptor subunit TctC